MEIPNISTNNGSPDWGLHRFQDGVVFHCAKNPNGFWTAIGPAKELIKPIKLVLGQIELPVSVNLIEDKYMSGHSPVICEKKGGLVKKTAKAAKVVKTTAKKTASKLKKSKGK